MNMHHINFASNNNYSYVEHSCISHELIDHNFVQYTALVLYHGNTFEDKVQLDWPL